LRRNAIRRRGDKNKFKVSVPDRAKGELLWKQKSKTIIFVAIAANAKSLKYNTCVITMFVITKTTKNKLTQRTHAIWVSGTKTQMEVQI
jgi:hypothetical protein